jgi:hypothetical protein
MKLLFIYGPPAAGKLTVANEIAKRTGIKVFHNHLSIDCIQPIFEFGTPSFGRLVNLIRYETIEEAAKRDVDLIYTYCYAKDLDDAHVEEIVSRVEGHGGEVCFVQLYGTKDELARRVTNESRNGFGKVKSTEMLDYFYENYDLFSPVNGRESLSIDNTSLSPEAAAERVITYFKLARQEKVQ